MHEHATPIGALQRIIPSRGSKKPVTVTPEAAEIFRVFGSIEAAPELGPNTWKPTKSVDANQIRDWLGKAEWERQVLDGEVPMLYVEHREKPENATYLAQATIESTGWGKMTPGEFGWGALVKVTWYENRVRFEIPGEGPAAITQAYLTGDRKDVVIEITRDEEAHLKRVRDAQRELEELDAKIEDLNAEDD